MTNGHKESKALSLLGFAAVGLYTLWWLICAIVVIMVVLEILGMGLFGWLDVTGWRRLYLLLGSLTLAALLLRLGASITRAVIDLARRPVYLVVAIVTLGALPIILIPLVVVGWPFVVWLWWSEQTSIQPQPEVPPNPSLQRTKPGRSPGLGR